MLICYRRDDDKSIKFGLALKQWKIKGEVRIYVLLPQDTKKYCEVDIIYPPEYEWCFLETDNKNIVFNSKEIPKGEKVTFDKDVEEDLYYVWDDGALKHLERASRLYEYFNPIIEQYRKEALRIKENLFEEEYKNQLKEARNRGWDAELVSRKVPIQPYDFC